jgi:hypothetical protein
MKGAGYFSLALILFLVLGSQALAGTDEQLGNKAESIEKKEKIHQQDRSKEKTGKEDTRDRAETDRGRRPNDPKGVEIDQSTWKTDGVKPL